MKKGFTLFSIILLVLLIAWKSLLLVPTHDRQIAPFKLSASQKEQIRKDVKNLTAQEIVDYSIRLTAQELSFSRKVNCVHYANHCAAVCNYAFSVCSINGKAKPIVGTVKLWGIDLCEILYDITSDTFVMNHDFTEVRLPGATIYVDASLKDLIMNDCKVVIKN